MEKQVFNVLQRAFLARDPLTTTLAKIAAALSQSDILNGAACAFVEEKDSNRSASDVANMQEA
ncbi:hypothetical protein MUG10_16720 [Xanthomonas prunicola]|uniref:hypothetical protein n=1 Tax=Xanthomonas prunicola TaxID=2053930 RepID=UPI002078CEF4|nr:hypothetical protein [Xanthomonas prunicola]USI99649.1 hypothetical protein MUG10_16720 [Xanthomonas prunicola]